MYDDNNVFAKILRGEIPCKKIYEDEYALAFYDINPKAPIHALVITKGKYTCYTDFVGKAKVEEINGYNKAILKTAEQLGLSEDNGFRLIFNNGKASGQEVPHLHAHILGGKVMAF